MQLEFATKRTPAGYRYYLGIDTENKTFSRERGLWYTREDITEISKTDRRRIIERLENAGYTETDMFYPSKN